MVWQRVGVCVCVYFDLCGERGQQKERARRRVWERESVMLGSVRYSCCCSCCCCFFGGLLLMSVI